MSWEQQFLWNLDATYYLLNVMTLESSLHTVETAYVKSTDSKSLLTKALW